jgi:hypothetical protein
MERHHDRMIDGKVLRERQVEAGLDAALTQVRGEPDVDRDLVMRHRGLVIGARDPRPDAHRENREVVEEEGIEVIAVEDDQDVGLHRHELSRHFGIEPRDLAFRS